MSDVFILLIKLYRHSLSVSYNIIADYSSRFMIMSVC